MGVTASSKVLGVMGLCEAISWRRILLVTSTQSPTRSTAPAGPAQAYWPKTGLPMSTVKLCQSVHVSICLLGNLSLTLRSFARRPYSCRFVAVISPVARSAFRLKQRTVRKRHRTDTCCSLSSREHIVSVLQLSSSYGSCSSPVSICTFGRNRMIMSSVRASGGNRRRASPSDAVVVRSKGAASAKRSRCG